MHPCHLRRTCLTRGRYCKPKDLDIIFVEVNIEENAKSDVGLMNPDRALMRFEFLDALLRVANRKYLMVRSQAGPSQLLFQGQGGVMDPMLTGLAPPAPFPFPGVHVLMLRLGGWVLVFHAVQPKMCDTLVDALERVFAENLVGEPFDFLGRNGDEYRR